MRFAHSISCVLALGCGRIGFAPQELDGLDGDDDATGDARKSVPRDAIEAGQHWLLVESTSNYSTQDGSARIEMLLHNSVAGDLIVVGMHIYGTPTISISDDASNSYQEATGTFASNGIDSVDLWYAVNATSGAKTLSVNASPSNLVEVAAWDFATTGSATFDIGGQLSDGPTTLDASAPSLTTSRAGEVIVASTVGFNASVVDTDASSGFSDDVEPKGDGFAHLVDASAAAGSYQASWPLNNSSTYCADAAAFAIGP